MMKFKPSKQTEAEKVAVAQALRAECVQANVQHLERIYNHLGAITTQMFANTDVRDGSRLAMDGIQQMIAAGYLELLTLKLRTA